MRVALLMIMSLGLGLLLGCKEQPKGSHAATEKKPAAKATTLPVTTPAQAHLDEAALKAFAGQVQGNGVVLRQGAVAFSWGEPRKAKDVASASKPVLAHLVFKAVEEGRIGSLDEPVTKWLPELTGKNAAITWRHLITQTSCYGTAEAPGTAFDYNDYQTALLWRLIYEKVNGVTPDQAAAKVLGPQLFDKLGAEDHPSLRIREPGKVSGRLVISPYDFARFGLLYQHGGQWQGQQLISAAHVKLALESPLPFSLKRSQGQPGPMLPEAPSYGGGVNQEDHLGAYSYLWWLNKADASGRLLWPEVPGDAFAAVGNGGIKVMMVMPGLDLIVSWNDAAMKPLPMSAGGREQMNAALKLLMAAVK